MSWTPITEQMPPVHRPVLLKQQKEGWKPFVIIGELVGRFSVAANSDYAEGEYDEDQDEYFVPEGFYERVYNFDELQYIGLGNEFPVIEWMEIPE